MSDIIVERAKLCGIIFRRILALHTAAAIIARAIQLSIKRGSRSISSKKKSCIINEATIGVLYWRDAENARVYAILPTGICIPDQT